MARRSLSSHAIVLVAILITYIPVVVLTIFSFNESRSIAAWRGFSTKWYYQLLIQHDLWEAMSVSLLLAAVVGIASTGLALCAALALPQMSPVASMVATGLLTMPLVLPDVILGASLAIGLQFLCVPRSVLTVACGHIVFGVAYAYVVLAAGVAGLDESLPEAARDLGASPRRAFRHVTLPLLQPHLSLALLLVMAVSFDDFLVTFFCKGVGYDTLPIRLYAQMRFGIKPVTNAMFVLLLLSSVVGSYTAGRIARRVDWHHET